MVTPFDEQGFIRYDSFERNIDKYIGAGIEGFLVLGSNGESVYLEHSEKVKLIKAARSRIPSLHHGRRFELVEPLAEPTYLHAVREPT